MRVHLVTRLRGWRVRPGVVAIIVAIMSTMFLVLAAFAVEQYGT